MSEPQRDVNLKAILVSGAGLALLLVVTAALMYPVTTLLRDASVATDPEAPFLPEAREQEPPPEPRLQSDPADDMRRLRAEEEALLTSWEWTAEGETARIPIERALEIVTAAGLPSTPDADAGEKAGDGAAGVGN